MVIVASTYFLRHLRNLDFFTLDLGKTRKIVGSSSNEFRKLDEFTVKYKNLYDRDILKFGSIADKINFYEDLRMDNNLYVIFKDDDIYEVSFKQEDLVDLRNYILETLRKIDDYEEEEKSIEDKNQEIVKKELGDEEGWVAKDDKNAGKRYLINQTLSKEDYREEVRKRLLKSKK